MAHNPLPSSIVLCCENKKFYAVSISSLIFFSVLRKNCCGEGWRMSMHSIHIFAALSLSLRDNIYIWAHPISIINFIFVVYFSTQHRSCCPCSHTKKKRELQNFTSKCKAPIQLIHLQFACLTMIYLPPCTLGFFFVLRASKIIKKKSSAHTKESMMLYIAAAHVRTFFALR